MSVYMQLIFCYDIIIMGWEAFSLTSDLMLCRTTWLYWKFGDDQTVSRWNALQQVHRQVDLDRVCINVVHWPLKETSYALEYIIHSIECTRVVLSLFCNGRHEGKCHLLNVMYYIKFWDVRCWKTVRLMLFRWASCNADVYIYCF